MVAVEDVGILLRALEERQEIRHVGIGGIGCRGEHGGGRRGRAHDGVDHVGVAVVDFEGVEVADENDLCGGVGGEFVLDERGHGVGLGGALGADAGAVGAESARGGVGDSIQRAEMVDEDREGERAATLGGGATEAEGGTVVEHLQGVGAGAEVLLVLAELRDGFEDDVRSAPGSRRRCRRCHCLRRETRCRRGSVRRRLRRRC